VKSLMISVCLLIRQSEERSRKIRYLHSFANDLYTSFPHKMWKTGSILACLFLVSSLSFVGCSSLKGIQKTKPAGKISETILISAGEDDVIKAYGQPTTISRTAEGHIYWIYEPSMKLWPNKSGSRYVEFESDRVVRNFRIK
jgi:hypothetical protein